MENINQQNINTITDDLIVDVYQKENQFKQEQELNKDQIKRSFHKIEFLNLSYQLLYKINGLRGFSNLQNLKLDNNKIRKMENLDRFPSLKKLDLSFNYIEEIEGLEQIQTLEDLSLFHNKIKNVHKEKIEMLVALQYLSLGHNQIQDASYTLSSLKALQSLRILKLSNNPISSDPDYRPNVIKHLSQIQYFDGKLISLQEKQELGLFKNRENLNEDQANLDHKQNKQNLLQETLQLKMESFNLVNYDQYLLCSNSDMKNLMKMNNKFEESTQKFNESVRQVVDLIRQRITESYQQRIDLEDSYKKAIEQIMQENSQDKQQIIHQYIFQKENLLKKIEIESKEDFQQEINDQIEKLKDMEQALISQELECKLRLTKGQHKMDQNLKQIQKKIENNIIGESGIKQIDGAITEFFNLFLEEAIQEVQKIDHYFQGTESGNQTINTKNSSQWEEETENFFGSVDDLKTGIQNIKDSIETTHRKQESIIQKVIDQDSSNYLESQSQIIKKYTRTNTFNIIQLVLKEKEFWSDILLKETTINK